MTMRNRARPPSLKLVHSQTTANSTMTRLETSHLNRQNLQLVVASSPTDDESSKENSQHIPRKSQQLSLFDEGERVLLGIVNVDRIRGIDFEAMLREIRPKWLIDLRVVPHFLIDRINRKYAFHIFEECRIEYLDMATELRIRTRKDASLSSGRIAREIMRIWKDHGASNVQGSIIFLVDDDEIAQLSAKVFPETLEPRPKAGWDTRFLN